MAAARRIQFNLVDRVDSSQEQAISLGRDREHLQERRHQLLDPTADLPLFDTAAWVRHWEEQLSL